ncbi:hypothetical protein HMPREF1544_00255 [Mucor circinelloides 1006PhL]|uniref:RGS domain-containing protein n=1 Tax=Mucor circinelloides f. circinelloides (strain 1006PhL) TaxID=1220926 RepID=S2JRE4_MUCC1|nr:hypothetical protein HMPREF1544_00255 [Mucor circinelloides 1006PhL]
MPNSASLSTYTTMMRVNSKGRPYAKDLFDIYSALLIQQPLTDHRSLFRTYPSTFTTDEAVESLGNLEFTHLVSTPNPLDASNPILTRTTTTFSMSRAMAKTLGQHFINARLTENATDPQNRAMKDRGIWSPTPKGKFMIQDFSRRARVPIKHMQSHLARIQTFPIVQFERLLDDDQISFSRQNMIEAFKTMMEWLPTDTILFDDVAGVSSENITQYKDAFYGYQCFEWISEYTSVVSSEESEMIAAEFVQYGWMLQILDKSDKLSVRKDESTLFKYDRRTQYYLTEKGRQTLEANRFLHGTSSNHGSHNTAPSSRSRTQSSAATTTNTATSSGSSSSSIKTNNSAPPQPPLKAISLNKSKKEEYASRLLPTTAITSLPDSTIVIPKAIITKQKSIISQQPLSASSDDMRVACSSDSMLQIDNHSCDFGFSSASSTASSAATTVPPPSSAIAGVEYEQEEEQESEDGQNLHERLEQLRLHNRSDSGTALYASSDHCQQHQPHSQHARLESILEDPLIRMYFRHFLKSCFCEENINFWVDYTALIKKLGYVSEDKDTIKPEEILSLPSKFCDSLLVHCCSIYNNYFCPENAPSELNIDHGLRYDIVQYMQATFTSTVYSSDEENANAKAVVADASNVPFGSISVSSHGILSSTAMSSFRRRKRRTNKNRSGTGVDSNRSDLSGASLDDSLLLSIRDGVQDSPQTCLYKILHLYDQANSHICRIMAQDSVPRFMKTQRYKELMQSYYLSPEERKKKLNMQDEDVVEEEDSGEDNDTAL